MGLLGKLSFWKKPKVSAVQPVIVEEVTHVELRPLSVQETIREEGKFSELHCPQNEGATAGVPSEPSTSSRLTCGHLWCCVSSSRSAKAQPKISDDSDTRTPSPSECGDTDSLNFDAKPEQIYVGITKDSDTRTPSPSECGDTDSLNFDAKPEQIYVGITKEFGHMIGSSLQSNKWDRRCQALKSMIQVLKGLDLEGMAPPGFTGVLGSLRPRDPVRRWRLTCQLLHHVIRDKVMPVRLAALDLYQQTFSHLECLEKVEVAYAAGVLVEHLVDRVGDSNVRLHEAARRCLIFTAEEPLLGVQTVLGRLRDKLQSGVAKAERAKVGFGVLDTVVTLVEHFSEEVGFNSQELAPFILAGLDDCAGPRVRTCAVQLAGHVYGTHGFEAMEPILQRLRPAKQALLKSKFQEMDEDGAEEDDSEGEERPDLDGFLVGCAAVAANELDHSPSSEESLMDGILEDVGLVFQGEGIIHEDPEKELDDSWLEEELLSFCVEPIDEQQALMSLLEEVSPQSTGEAGAGRHSDLSVEVF